jgi:hypothetical protein
MPKRVQGKVDPKSMFRRGASFHNASVFLNNQPMQVLAQMTFAWVTCQAFACEAFLKVLTQLERRLSPLETHHLRHLFNDISPETQGRIRAEWTDKCLPGVNGSNFSGQLPTWWDAPQSFDQALDKCAKAFVDWRYKDSETTPLYFHLTGLPGIIRRIILERKPEWAESVTPSGPINPQSKGRLR